jgi:hypothetical protein
MATSDPLAAANAKYVKAIADAQKQLDALTKSSTAAAADMKKFSDALTTAANKLTASVNLLQIGIQKLADSLKPAGPATTTDPVTGVMKVNPSLKGLEKTLADAQALFHNTLTSQRFGRTPNQVAAVKAYQASYIKPDLSLTKPDEKLLDMAKVFFHNNTGPFGGKTPTQTRAEGLKAVKEASWRFPVKDGLPSFEKPWYEKAEDLGKNWIKPSMAFLGDFPSTKALKPMFEAGAKAGDALKKPFWKETTTIDPQTGKEVVKGSWNFDDIKGRNGGAKQFAAGAAAVTAGIGAYNSLKDATNVKGTGKRVLAGAATGASIGTQILPGWGTAVGAGVGALVGLIRKPGFEKVFKDVKKNYGGIELSDDTAKAIDKTAKDTFKGDRGAAQIFSLDQIISEGKGVKDSNVSQLTARLRDAFSMKETGKFTDAQLTETLDKNFASFAEHVVKSKKLASAEFQELIALNKRFGSESKAVQEFITGQTGSLGGSIANLAAPLIGEFEKLTGTVAETQAAIEAMEEAGKGGTAEHAALVKSLGDSQLQLKEKVAGSSAEFERLGIIAMASFNASIAGGTDTLTAMAQLGPGLDQLIMLQEKYGQTSQNAALNDLVAFRGRVEANQALVAGAGALGEAMLALSSIGGLNQETFAALEQQGLATFTRLTDAKFTDNEALMQMKGWLEATKEAHEKLGYPIDANTEALIRQAEESGILKKTQEQMNQENTDALKETTAALYAVAQALGADIPAAADKTKKAIDSIPNQKIIKVDYEESGLPGGGDGAASATTEGFAKGTGGFRNFGSGTLAMLHGWEAVIPMNQLAGGGGGGQGVQVNVWLNDQIIGRAAARGLPALLDVYGATR